MVSSSQFGFRFHCRLRCKFQHFQGGMTNINSPGSNFTFCEIRVTVLVRVREVRVHEAILREAGFTIASRV
jgi:hypothetical protein